MPFEYVNFKEARAADGLRMVVVVGVPSPWTEASYVSRHSGARALQ